LLYVGATLERVGGNAYNRKDCWK